MKRRAYRSGDISFCQDDARQYGIDQVRAAEWHDFRRPLSPPHDEACSHAARNDVSYRR